MDPIAALEHLIRQSPSYLFWRGRGFYCTRVFGFAQVITFEIRRFRTARARRNLEMAVPAPFG